MTTKGQENTLGAGVHLFAYCTGTGAWLFSYA